MRKLNCCVVLKIHVSATSSSRYSAWAGMRNKREVIERWEQHFDENLNGEENVGTEDQGSGRNDFIGAAKDKNESNCHVERSEGSHPPVQKLQINW